MTTIEIDRAINEADLVASEIHHNGHTCAVNNVTLLALIRAAKELLAVGLWTKERPKTEGAYAFRCGENEGEAECVKVSKVKGVLMADSEHLGKITVADFCDGLTNPEWRMLR